MGQCLLANIMDQVLKKKKKSMQIMSHESSLCSTAALFNIYTFNEL